jgi:hypothetical protein
MMDYPVDNTCTQNAEVIANEVERIFREQNKKVVLFGYSKGRNEFVIKYDLKTFLL